MFVIAQSAASDLRSAGRDWWLH